MKQVEKIIRKGNTGYKKIYSIIKSNNKIKELKGVGDLNRRRYSKSNRQYRFTSKRNI